MATKSGDSGRKFPVSHACVRLRRGERVTGHGDGSSCIGATRELESHFQEIIRHDQEFNFGSHSKCLIFKGTRFEYRLPVLEFLLY